MAEIRKIRVDGTDYDVRDTSKVSTSQGTANAGKIMQVGADGSLAPTSALTAKVDVAQGTANAGKALIVNASGNVAPDVIHDTSKVSFDEAQTLTDAQKARARGNIGAASAENVADIKSAVDEIIEESDYRVYTKNLINTSTCTSEVLSVADGTTSSDSAWRTTDYERINPDSVYSAWVFDGTGLNSSIICTYDASKNYIAGKNSNSGTNYKVTESNAYYIRVSFAATMIDSVRCVEGTVNKPYTAYSNIESASTLLNTYKVNHLYVATTGNDATGNGTKSNPFATIYKANTVISDADEKNRYIIHVADGTYTDLQTRYSGITGTNYQGIVCKDYVSYIGNVEDPTKCILKWDGATGFTGTVTDADITWKTIFQILQSGNSKSYHVEIAGFTIESTNTRYCQHIEISGYGYGVDWHIHDCIFIWHGQPALNNPSYIPATLGTGCGLFEHGKFERCKIVNDAGLTLAYANHDNPSRYSELSTVKPGADIVFRDCVFNGGAVGRTNIRCRSMYTNEGAETYDLIHVINCHGIDKLEYTTANGATINWRADVVASDIVTNEFDNNA